MTARQSGAIKPTTQGTIDWPASNRNAGRNEIGTGGRLRFGINGRLHRNTHLIAGLATAPFQAFHFHRLNPYGLLGNAIAVPLCSIIVMPAALAGVVLYPLGLDSPAWLLMGYGITVISMVAEQVSAIAGAVATVPRFSIAALSLLAIAIACFTLMTTRIFHICAVAVGTLGAVVAMHSPRPAIIIASEGRHALIATANGLVLLGKGRPAFALQQWLPGEGDGRGPREASISAHARCDTLGCTTILQDGRSVAVVLERAAFVEDCERAAVIITPLRAPEFCDRSAVVFDQSYFRSYGATYLYIAKQPLGFHAETARSPRHQRPWIPSASAPTNAPKGAPLRTSDATMPEKTQPLPPVWDPQAPDNSDDLQ